MKSTTLTFAYTTKSGKTAGQTKLRKLFVMSDNGYQASGIDLNLLSPLERITVPIKYRNHHVTAGSSGKNLPGYNKIKKAWRKFDKIDMMF